RTRSSNSCCLAEVSESRDEFIENAHLRVLEGKSKCLGRFLCVQWKLPRVKTTLQISRHDNREGYPRPVPGESGKPSRLGWPRYNERPPCYYRMPA
ncbi:hypothetical protein FOZ60_000396, partial [Perkinsus olseni]